MTSEVCVMNRRAIVLASDSAATVTSFENGGTEERYFKGSNKIFELSSQQALGLMIFNSADLQKVPWDIIVKAFRSNLGLKQCGSINDYATKFFEFIEKHRGLFPSDLLLENFSSSADQAIISILRSIENTPSVQAAQGDAAALNAARTTALDAYHQAFSAMPLVCTLQPADFAEARERSRLNLEREIGIDITQLCPGLVYPLDKLVYIAVLAIFTMPKQYLNSTGLVIAGYGDEDYFPSYKE